ncbi:MAG: squalene synthase HpnD [Zetaproteobacteria bacterium]|nr:MAG: squalene synthase HpnD [Zetaproteobacteria bacterium]
MTPQHYCEQRTRGAGSSFFYAFLFLPPEQRRAMMALYAFCREVDDIADEIRDREVARRKLGFWQQEIARLFDDHDAPTHPVGRELAWVRGRFPIERTPFDEMIAGMLWDIEGRPIADDAELRRYCHYVAGTVGLLTIAIFGCSHPLSRAFAERLGLALQLTNILRDVAEDAANGRIYLPQQARIRHRVADQDLIEGNMHEGVRRLLADYRAQAGEAYRAALACLPAEEREALRASLIMASLYYHHLLRLQRVDGDVWRRPVTISPLGKIWIAWRMARREARAAKRGAPVRLTRGR